MNSIKAGPAGPGRATKWRIHSSVERLDDLSRPRCTESPQLSHLHRRATISEMIARGPTQPPTPPFSEAVAATEQSKQTPVCWSTGPRLLPCVTAPLILSCTDANFASATPSTALTVKSIQLKGFEASINGQDSRTE